MNDAALAETVRRMMRLEAFERARHAVDRGLIRPHLSHSEQAELFGYCLPLALTDVVWGKPFHQFVAEWIETFGADVQPHLLSLYLAAVSSCSMGESGRRAAILTALDHQFDDEAD